MDSRQIAPRAASRRLQSSTTTAYLNPSTYIAGALEAGTDCVDLPFDAVFKGKTALPKALDMLLIVDTTGSMSSVIATAQAQALDLLSALRDAGIKDLRTAVADVRDYPGEYLGGTCGEVYGGVTDYPWLLHQALTSNDTLVQNALSSLSLGDGYDAPEAYLTALYHAVTDKAIGWRGDGVAKVVVEFGDNIPHSCSSKICPHDFVTGIEPGADRKVGTADDVTMDKVITGLRNSDITLFQIGNEYDTYGVWSCIAKATGGVAAPMGTDIATQITSLITDSFDNIGDLELGACPSNSSTVEEGVTNSTAYITGVSPEHYYSIALNESSKSFKFNAKVCPPVTEETGTYNVSFCLVGDNATLATAVATVRVVGAPTPKPTPMPSPKPTPEPTATPTATPTAKPSLKPTPEPTSAPSAEPTATPTAAPTFEPTFAPSFKPTSEPTTATPTAVPTEAPTEEPTAAPSESPTFRPTKAPTFNPTHTRKPTAAPSLEPTAAPSPEPTPPPVVVETAAPTVSNWTIELGNFRAGCTQGAVRKFLLQRVAASGAVMAEYNGGISSGCPVGMTLDSEGNPMVVGYTSGATPIVASTGGQRRLQDVLGAAEDFVLQADADTLAELCAYFPGSVEALGLPDSVVVTDGGVDATVYLTMADDSEFTFQLYNDGVCESTPLTASSDDEVSVLGRNIGIALSAVAAAAVLLSLAASPLALSAAAMGGVTKDGNRSPATTLAVHSIYHLQFVAVAGLAAGGSAHGVFRSFAESLYWTNLWWAFPGGSDRLDDGDCSGVDSAGVSTDISLGNSLLILGLLPAIFLLHLLLASLVSGRWVARRLAADRLVLEAEFAAETVAAAAAAREESQLPGTRLDEEDPSGRAHTGFGSEGRANSQSSSQASTELTPVKTSGEPTESMERMRELWASSSSLLLHPPNIELVFLLWAYEGTAVAQLSMATRACSWGAVVLGVFLWLVFPVLLLLYVWQFVMSRVHSDSPFFVYLYENGGAARDKEPQEMSRGVSSRSLGGGGGGGGDSRRYYGGGSSRRIAVVPAGAGVRDEVGEVSRPVAAGVGGSPSHSRSGRANYGGGSGGGGGGRSSRVSVVPDRTADDPEEVKQEEETKEERESPAAAEASAAAAAAGSDEEWERDTDSSAAGGEAPSRSNLQQNGSALALAVTSISASGRGGASPYGERRPGSLLRQASSGVLDELSGGGSSIGRGGLLRQASGRSASIFEWAECGSWRVTGRDKAARDPAERSSLLVGLAPLYGDYHSEGMPYFILSLGLIMATAVAVTTITHGSAALAALLGLTALDLLALLWLQPFGNAAINFLETSAVFCNLATIVAVLAAATLPESATSSGENRDKALTAAVIFAVASVLVVAIPCYVDLAAILAHSVCKRLERRQARKDARPAAVAAAAAPNEGRQGGTGTAEELRAAKVTAVETAMLRPTAREYREGLVIALRGNVSLTMHVLAKSFGHQARRRPKARAIMPRRPMSEEMDESAGRGGSNESPEEIEEENLQTSNDSVAPSELKGSAAPTELEAPQRRLSGSLGLPLGSSQDEILEQPQVAEERADGGGGVQEGNSSAHAPRF